MDVALPRLFGLIVLPGKFRKENAIAGRRLTRTGMGHYINVHIRSVQGICKRVYLLERFDHQLM
jgi:hypothetical protein